MASPDHLRMVPTGGDTRRAILESPTCRVAEAALVIGVSEWALRRAINSGDAPVPVIRLGRRIIVPVAPLRRLLGLDEEAAP